MPVRASTRGSIQYHTDTVLAPGLPVPAPVAQSSTTVSPRPARASTRGSIQYHTDTVLVPGLPVPAPVAQSSTTGYRVSPRPARASTRGSIQHHHIALRPARLQARQVAWLLLLWAGQVAWL